LLFWEDSDRLAGGLVDERSISEGLREREGGHVRAGSSTESDPGSLVKHADPDFFSGLKEIACLDRSPGRPPGVATAED